MFDARPNALYHASPPKNRASILKAGLRANNNGEVYVSPGLNYHFNDLTAWDVWEVDPQGLRIETEDVGEDEFVISGNVPRKSLRLVQKSAVSRTSALR